MAKAYEKSLTSARDKRANKIHVHAQDSKGTRSKMSLLVRTPLASRALEISRVGVYATLFLSRLN